LVGLLNEIPLRKKKPPKCTTIGFKLRINGDPMIKFGRIMGPNFIFLNEQKVTFVFFNIVFYFIQEF
jgi:hypothetical protein